MPRVEAFAQIVLARLPPASLVLEVGCGDGRLAQILATAGHRVVAIDREPKAGFPALATSFEDFDAGEERFDCIVASLVLHHIHELEACLQKMRSLLRSQGFLAIDDYGWERLDDATAQRRWTAGWEAEAAAWRADRDDLHRSVTMLNVLRRYFTASFYRDHPYFDDGAFEDALAFTFVGTPAARR
jgi:SAM-dependent methyltransferase